MKIDAAVIESADSDFVIREVELDRPRPDEVVVKLAAVGMCHTDLAVQSQATPFPLPAVLGHEGAGTVVEIGSRVADVAVGDRVIMSFDSCGVCASCRSGRPVYCARWIEMNLLGGSRLDGSPSITSDQGPVHGSFFGQSSFATHSLVHARSVIPVPDDLPLERLAPLGCSVQTGVGAILNVARPEPGSTVVVLGAGAVGLAAVLGAALTPGARLVAVDINSQRLKLAGELGATHTVDSSESDPVDAIRDLTDGAGADYVIETSGRLPVLMDGLRALAPAGTCVVIGAPPLGSTLAVDIPELLGRGLTLRGTNQGDSNPRQFLPQLFKLHREGRLPFDRLITPYALTEINSAARDAASGTSIKPVILFGETLSPVTLVEGSGRRS